MPTRVQIPNGISIGSAVFALCTAEYRYTLHRAAPFPLKITPSHGDLDPHLTHDSLGPSEPTTQTASQSVQPFLHSSPQSVPILYNGMPLLLKIASSHGNKDPHLIHGSLGPPKFLTRTASPSIQPFLQGSLL